MFPEYRNGATVGRITLREDLTNEHPLITTEVVEHYLVVESSSRKKEDVE